MHHNIILRELSRAEIDSVYNKRMSEDFPPKELKKKQLITSLLDRGLYEGIGAFEENNLVGYSFFSIDISHRFYLLDYFAVSKELRGMGYGVRILELIKERYKDVVALICEIENPYFEENPALKTQQLKRLEFYQSNGWDDTKIDAFMYGVEYRLLNAKLENEMRASDILKAYELIYLTAVGKESLKDNMRLRMHDAPINMEDEG